MSDLLWQDNIRTGSANLIAAIRAAREGTCVVTRPEPVKLPMDYSYATGPKPDNRVRVKKPEHGGVDEVERLMSCKKGAGEIAKELGVTMQKATWMMAGVRKRRTRSELDQALRAKLWG